MAECVLLAIHFERRGSSKCLLRETEALEANWVGEASLEVILHAVHVNFVVWALWAGESWLNRSQIELHDSSRVFRVGHRSIINTVKSLSLQVCLDHADTVWVSSDQVEILDSLVVHGEEAHGCAVLWGHVSDRSSVSEGEVGAAWSEELHKLSNDTALAEHVGAGEDKISGSGMGRQFACELEANDLREHHRDLLAKHDRLSLDTTDTPTDNTKAIDHSGVRVSTDNGVRVQDTILLEDDTSEILEIHLMNNTVAWWDNAEVGEGGLAPLEEGKPLLVPIELDLLVLVLCVGSTGDIDLDRVVHNEVNLAERIDLAWITAVLLHGSSHRGQINHSWNAGEVLKNDTGRLEGDLKVLLRGHLPVQDSLNIGG